MTTTDQLDTAEMIGQTADDPTPTEIVDVNHEDYVVPYPQATPIGEESK